MTANHVRDAVLVPVDALIVPQEYITKSSKVDDEILQNSVRLTGIQQPLIVTHLDQDKFYVIDGVRRLAVAKSLDLEVVPCVVDHGVDDVADRDEYRNRIRFILDEHRQDLLPTQRAKLIRQLQKTFGMSSRELGLYLGVTSATITNWLLIEKVIPEVQQSIDDGKLKIHSARAFASMTPEGQREVWTTHNDAATTMSGERLHKWIRDTYPPAEHTSKYDSPEKVIQQLNRKDAGRNGKKRATISGETKVSLAKDFEVKKVEIDDKKSQVQSIQEDIDAAIPVIEALRDDRELWESLPKAIRSDFEEFAERNIA